MMAKGKTIFLIDDDEDDRQLFYEAALEVDLSLTCTFASTAGEGMELLRKKRSSLPDLIFLDLNLPGMNGFECLAEIKKDPDLLSLPVIIYSTSKKNEYIKVSRNLGAAWYFEKPNEFSEICKAISFAIEMTG